MGDARAAIITTNTAQEGQRNTRFVCIGWKVVVATRDLTMWLCLCMWASVCARFMHCLSVLRRGVRDRRWCDHRWHESFAGPVLAWFLSGTCDNVICSWNHVVFGMPWAAHRMLHCVTHATRGASVQCIRIRSVRACSQEHGGIGSGYEQGHELNQQLWAQSMSGSMRSTCHMGALPMLCVTPHSHSHTFTHIHTHARSCEQTTLPNSLRHVELLLLLLLLHVNAKGFWLLAWLCNYIEPCSRSDRNGW